MPVPPDALIANPRSHTGRELAAYRHALEHGAPRVNEPRAAYAARPTPRAGDANAITIVNAREHNLKSIDVSIPRDTFTVITGVSGSGKSTLAFDILFNEGQRRYLESLNAYARSIVQPAGRPDVDAIHGIPPTVAIEQRTSRGGRKSTVATLTEIYHFLRLLYVKLGVQHCPDCNVPVTPQSFDTIVAQVQRDYRGQHVGVLAPLVVNRKGVYTDSPSGRRAAVIRTCASTARSCRRRSSRASNASRNTRSSCRSPTWSSGRRASPSCAARSPARSNTATVSSPSCPLLDGLAGAIAAGNWGPALAQRSFSTKRACPSCGTSFPEPDPRLFSYNSKHGWRPSCFGTGVELTGFDAEQSGEEVWWNAWYEGETAPCRRAPGSA